jgi:hypothetical protein
LSKNKSELSRYLKQLAILARLRKLEALTVKITEEMPIVYDIETDYLYLQGVEKGFDKGKILFVQNLLANTNFADDKMALKLKKSCCKGINIFSFLYNIIANRINL